MRTAFVIVVLILLPYLAAAGDLAGQDVTIVDAAAIQSMNAHTLADVLNTVTGVQVQMNGGPGQIALTNIQGSDPRHVTVLIDGIVLNNISDGVFDISMMPVQNIEKIEITKGAASSVWGSSLGGVVNVITKTSRNDDQGGMLSASLGTMRTGDVREEARGKHDRFGYYMTAGALRSDGLTPGFDVAEYNAYTKLSYDVSESTDILFTLGYISNSRGTGQDEINGFAFGNTMEVMSSSLAVISKLSSNLDLNVSVHRIEQTSESQVSQLSDGAIQREDVTNDTGYGSSAKLSWKGASQTVVFGADYDEKFLQSASIVDGEKGMQQWAGYVNDAVSLDKLTITPGVRYDHTSTNGAFTSPVWVCLTICRLTPY